MPGLQSSGVRRMRGFRGRPCGGDLACPERRHVAGGHPGDLPRRCGVLWTRHIGPGRGTDVIEDTYTRQARPGCATRRCAGWCDRCATRFHNYFTPAETSCARVGDRPVLGRRLTVIGGRGRLVTGLRRSPADGHGTSRGLIVAGTALIAGKRSEVSPLRSGQAVILVRPHPPEETHSPPAVRREQIRVRPRTVRCGARTATRPASST